MNFNFVESISEYFTSDFLVRLLVSMVIFLIFYLFRKKFVSLIFNILKKVLFHKKNVFIGELLDALKIPTSNVMIVLGVYFALLNIGVSNVMLLPFVSSAIVIAMGVGFYKLGPFYESAIRRGLKGVNKKASEMLIQTTVKIINFIIIVITFLVVCGEFFDIGAFIASLGIVGFAFAFAAQESLASVVAGASLLIDSPFDVGDYIQTSEFDGIVEGISFRSTWIRTFQEEVLVIPNTRIASDPILNYSQRDKRRIKFNVGVMYKTSVEEMQNVVDEIKTFLVNNKRIHEENIVVKFTDFEDSALAILINCYGLTNEWEEYLDIKEEINYKVLRIFESHGVSCAFPSSSLYFENELKMMENMDEKIQLPNA